MIHLVTDRIIKEPQSPFLDKKGVMKTFGICISTMNKWLYEEGLKYYKVRELRVFIKREDLMNGLRLIKKIPRSIKFFNR